MSAMMLLHFGAPKVLPYPETLFQDSSTERIPCINNFKKKTHPFSMRLDVIDFSVFCADKVPHKRVRSPRFIFMIEYIYIA